MKNYLLPIFALLIVGCGNRGRPNMITENNVGEIEQKDSIGNAFASGIGRVRQILQNSPLVADGNYKIIMGDAIKGDYDGDGEIDIAYSYCVDEDSENEILDGFGGVIFSDSTIQGIMSPWLICFLLNEGDLNGDGADELGFYARGTMSGWGTYSVCSFRNGQWHELASVAYNSNFDDYLQDGFDRNDLVRIDPNRQGYLLIRELEMEDGDWVQRVEKSVKIK